MYIVTRYVVWEVVKFFLAALFGLTLIVTFGMAFKEGMSKGLPPLVMLHTMPFMLPEILGISIPISMLLAVSTVFGRMTGTNEVVAIKSLGISPMALVWPVLVLAAFFSLGTVWMYEIAATWCRPTRTVVVMESIEDIALSMLQTRHSFPGEFPCDLLSIIVKGVENREGKRVLIQPTITINGPPKTMVTAAEAELHTTWQRRGRQVGKLVIVCRQVVVDVEGSAKVFAEELQREFPIEVPPPDPYHRDWVSMRAIPNLIARLQAEVRGLEQILAARKALGEKPSPAALNQIAEVRHKIDRLKTEPYRRWSNGFTCLCFALIGMPVAMLWRHADLLTNFFVCFLPILAVYYPLLMFGEDLTTSGTLPPVFFWMGNVVLTVPAIALLRWTIRH
jgi:lipopolysaccharide export system permease protein